ncbi:MAG: type II secretion system GspH family protein [Gemmatimonadetes bacterium]|nr:type II secretion system GspH family protein [Gemmatimonadota bacterium]
MNRVRCGFALIEAVVALMMLGLTVAFAMALAGEQLRAVQRGGRLIEARALAEDRLSAVGLSPRADLVRVPDSLARGRFEPPFDTYRWNVACTETRDEVDLFDVKIEVTWEDGAYRLETRLFRPQRTLAAER